MSIKKPKGNQLILFFSQCLEQRLWAALREWSTHKVCSDISNVDNLFCEPASPKAVRGLSGPSRNSLGTLRANN